MMRTMLHKWFVRGVLVFAALAGLTVAGSASGDGVSPHSIMGRDHEPVIVTGSDLPVLLGTPVESMFVYAHRGGGWEQIPFQVDRMVSGVYTTTVSGPLGPEDEAVFMTADLGDMPSPVQLASSLPISPTWYQIEVTDSLSPTTKGWAYIVGSATLTKTFTETYASFDAITNQITTPHYAIGFAATHPGFEYLALNRSGVDILDRTKIRVQTFLGTLTEDGIGAVPVGVVKNGPVRVIARGGAIIGYRSSLYATVVYTLPPLITTGVRVSTDFAPSVVTSTFHNANTPAGVSVDGLPDLIAPTPLSPWVQVSGNTGVIVQVSDASLTGGTQTNYYKDDATPDPFDTGDLTSYGDSGVQVTTPGSVAIYHSVMFMLPPGMPNVGSLYAAYVAQPLQVAAVAQREVKLFVPLLLQSY